MDIIRAKEIAEAYDLSMVIVIGIKDCGTQHITTFGKSKNSSLKIADIGNQIKKFLGWPEKRCHAEPLKRVCENCDFFEQTEKTYYSYGKLKVPGKCFSTPSPTSRDANDTACAQFLGSNWK
jgi:hypothetical protein